MERLVQDLAQLVSLLVVQGAPEGAHPVLLSVLALACLQPVDHIKIEQRARRPRAQGVARGGNRTAQVLGAAQVHAGDAVESQRLRRRLRAWPCRRVGDIEPRQDSDQLTWTVSR